MNTHRHWLSAIALLFIATVLLVANISNMHLRADEDLVYVQTRGSLREAVQYQSEQDVHPPAWFSSFWLWRNLVGDSEWAGRVQTVLFSMLTLALVYQVGRRWFGAARYGLIAMALLAVNAFFVVHALEIRPYGLMMLVATVSMWTFQQWLAQRTWRCAVYYALTLPVMLFVHYFLFVLILTQAVYFVVYWLVTRQGVSLLRQASSVVMVAGLVWLPWFPIVVYQILHLRASDTAGGNERGLFGSGATTIPTSRSAIINLAELATNGLAWLVVALLIVGVMVWWRNRNFWLALAWALLAPAISLALNQVLAVYLPRYVVYLAVGLALAVAAALGRLPRLSRIPAVVAVVALSLWMMPTHWPVERVPYRDVYRQVSVAAGPQDVIIFDAGGLRDGFVRAQIRRYLDPDLWRRRVSSIDEALQHRRIWYVTDGEWFTEATRQRFARIEATHPLQQVIGRCDRDWCYLLQLLEAAPYTEPVVFGDGLAFMGMDIDSISDDALLVRLWWIAQEAIPLDYSIGLHLLDANGQLVAQADGAITDQYSGEAIQTSQLVPGKLTIDVRQLRLPPDLPPDQYQPVVIVYQSWDNTRLTLPDGTDRWTMEGINLP